MKNLLVKYFFLFFCLCFFGCTKKSTETSQKPLVIVTISPYAEFVEKIAKDTVNVVTILPPGANLHTYEPSPSDVTKIHRGLVWFLIEEPLEKKLLVSLREKYPSLKEVNLQKNIPLLSMAETTNFDSCHGSQHLHQEGKDLHTWMSPSIVRKQIDIITMTLVELIPEHALFYKNNAQTYAQELLLLEENVKEILAPFKGNAILTSHPSLGYFCQDFGLIQLSVECEGKDPRPKDIENLLQKINLYKVKMVFVQKGFNNKGAELIGKKLHLPIHEVDPYAKDYKKNIHNIAFVITQ